MFSREHVLVMWMILKSVSVPAILHGSSALLEKPSIHQPIRVAPQLVGGGIGRSVPAKASSIILAGFSIACRMGGAKRHRLKSPASKDTCSSCIASGNFFPIPSFLANWLLMLNDIVVKDDLPLRGSRRNDALEMTSCSTHTDSPCFAALAVDRLWFHGSIRMML